MGDQLIYTLDVSMGSCLFFVWDEETGLDCIGKWGLAYRLGIRLRVFAFRGKQGIGRRCGMKKTGA